MIDPATTTKMTVQFNLFGGTVFRLGTEVSTISLFATLNLPTNLRDFYLLTLL